MKDFVTTAITNLGNKLANEVVTPQLRDRCVNKITSLASNKVRVEIARVGGRYGSPQYQVRFAITLIPRNSARQPRTRYKVAVPLEVSDHAFVRGSVLIAVRGAPAKQPCL